MSIKLTLTPEQFGTVHLALCGWSARCEGEAKAMRELADDFAKDDPELREKCLRNADASLNFQREADELLAELREQRMGCTA